MALVCQELARPNVRRRHTFAKLRAFPPGLDQLYERMMDQIRRSEDAEICKSILAIVSVVYRPITLVELVSFIDNNEDLQEIISLCGSFLTLRKGTISFIHQSAKNFLLEKASKEIFPAWMEERYYTIFSRSLEVITT